MTNLTCEHWRGVLAMDLLDKSNVAEHAGLLAHLDGCPECREISVELASTCDALALVDTSALAPPDAVSPQLTTAVLGALHRAGRARKRRRTTGVLVGAVSGLVAASLIVLAVLSGHSGGPSSSRRIESLHGSPKVTASVVLTSRVWGTAVDFREHGLAGRSVYVVSMETSSGRWWVAGTYRAAGTRSVKAVMACPLPLKEITGIRVTDASGTPILESYAAGADD